MIRILIASQWLAEDWRQQAESSSHTSARPPCAHTEVFVTAAPTDATRQISAGSPKVVTCQADGVPIALNWLLSSG